MAETVEQRQNLLNAACSAWNMACNPPALGKALDQYMREYEPLNADADRANLAGVRSDMEKLIQKKLEIETGDVSRRPEADGRCSVGARGRQRSHRNRIGHGWVAFIGVSRV
ncbi:MAG: hypothetical protein V3W34_11745 [Phycisphaerae bacterium]